MFARWITKKYFGPPGCILDIGAGDGTTMQAFEDIGFEAKGCDLYPQTKEIKKVDLEKEKLPYKSKQFDYVISKWVIEYLWQAHNMLSEANRVLKDGGRIAILTVDFSRAFRRFYNDFEHKRPYTKDSLRRLLNHHDFEIIEVENFSHIPLIWRWTTFAFDLRFWPRRGLFALAKK